MAGEVVWHVRLRGSAGRSLGTIIEIGGECQATTLTGGLKMRRFPDRDAAAAWLLGLGPRR
jgi:transposase